MDKVFIWFFLAGLGLASGLFIPVYLLLKMKNNFANK